MKYEIYQIQLTKEERNIVNTDPKGHFALDKQVTRISFDMKEGDELVDLVIHGLKRGYYEHKANIKANGLEDVFRIGNQDIPRSDNPNIYDDKGMYSVSIGDLIIDENKNMHVVASYGFTKI